MTEKPDYHHCHFCGEPVSDGIAANGKRHWLSDCRPDLVEHEIGPLCTWPEGTSVKDTSPGCYAYSESNFEPSEPGTVGSGLKWTKEHTHFYKDGPM